MFARFFNCIPASQIRPVIAAMIENLEGRTMMSASMETMETGSETPPTSLPPIVDALMKTKHDTVKNSLSNVR